MLAKLNDIIKSAQAKILYTKDEPKRYNDAVLIIRQDNKLKHLQIEASNYLAMQLLGVETNDIIEKDLRDFLPDNIRGLVDDNIQFTENGRGIDSVLNKIAAFKIKTLNGAEIPLKIRVIRSLSSSMDAPRFQLVMNDSSLMESLEAHRTNYRANMRGDEIIDKVTGLPSRESMLKDIELISFYTERNHTTSCYAIFKFINYDDLRLENDDDGALRLLQQLIKTIDYNRRTSDVVGMVAEGAVILVFPETPKENIKTPIQRIYNKLPKEIKSELRIYYSAIKPGIAPEEQLNACIKGMAGTF